VLRGEQPAGTAAHRRDERLPGDRVVRRFDVELAVVGAELVQVAGERVRVVRGDPLHQRAAELLPLPAQVGREHGDDVGPAEGEHEAVEVADQPLLVVDQGERLPDQLPLAAQLGVRGRGRCGAGGGRNRTSRGNGRSG
jgi:hypothetical protein